MTLKHALKLTNAASMIFKDSTHMDKKICNCSKSSFSCIIVEITGNFYFLQATTLSHGLLKLDQVALFDNFLNKKKSLSSKKLGKRKLEVCY